MDAKIRNMDWREAAVNWPKSSGWSQIPPAVAATVDGQQRSVRQGVDHGQAPTQQM